MKRYIELNDLTHMDFRVQNIECVEQYWTGEHPHYDYTQKPRPNSGLLFVYTPMVLTFFINDRTIVAGNGDIIYLPKGLYYYVAMSNIDSLNEPNSYVVNFDMFDENRNELFLDDTIKIMTNVTPRTLHKEIDLLYYAVHDVMDNCLKTNIAFLSLLHSVINVTSRQAKDLYPIRHGCKILQEEWQLNEPISKYAAASDVSETHFNVLFKKWSGITPVKYRNKLRISHAQTLLKNSNLTINQIANLTGFEDPFYFSRVFKNITGISPRDYRKI